MDALGVRFWSKVRISDDGCWQWTGARNADGYGNVNVGGRTLRPHRMMFAFVHGYEPAVVLHSCDNPSCVNPSHLTGGTQRDNVNDMMRKARGRKSFGESHGRSVLTEMDVLCLRSMSNLGVSTSELARTFGVSRPTIARCVTGKTWSHL